MSKEMLINIVQGQECRIAVVNDGVLEELYMERAASGRVVGNIYKGRVTNVEPSIQAAFVDYGAPKHGFLHISDVLPQYFPKGQREVERVGKKRSRKDRPPIQDCLRRGQEVICQIIKEGIGTKGPTLTTYLSVPGRFVVMMPYMTRHGVSRKIEDEEERTKLRQLLGELKPPEDMGFIIRTAGSGRPKRELQQDLNYLVRLWKSVAKRIKSAKAPAELYQESDLVIRTIRDVYSNEIARIICDDASAARKVADFLHLIMPRSKNEVKLYTGDAPLFHRYDLEWEIEQIYARKVLLHNGGSIVIDQTEALVAIDVNSGRSRESSDPEQTAFRTNVAAAKEIARQLRLRDMGGVIVIDFIDMRLAKHQRGVETVLRDAIKGDRARSKVLRISRFGIVEMTRQRVRPSLQHSVYRECPFCRGTAWVKSDESLALSVMRDLQLACADEKIAKITLSVAPGVAEYINNRRRRQLVELETDTGRSITIQADAQLPGDEVRFECVDGRGSVLAWTPLEQAARTSGRADKTAERLAEGELIDAADLPAVKPSQATVRPAEPADEKAEAKTHEKKAAEKAGEKAQQPPAKPKRRRGGRRHKKKTDKDQAADKAPTTDKAEEVRKAETPEPSAEPSAEKPAPTPADQPAAPDQPKKKRRHRAGRKHRRKKPAAESQPAETPAPGKLEELATVVAPAAKVEKVKKVEKAEKAPKAERVEKVEAVEKAEAPKKSPRARTARKTKKATAKKAVKKTKKTGSEPAKKRKRTRRSATKKKSDS